MNIQALLGFTLSAILFRCSFGRGNNELYTQGEEETEENYFPVPRQPVPYNSTYVKQSPNATYVHPYRNRKGYYTSFYDRYMTYTRTLRNTTKPPQYTPDTLVCVNTEADDTGISLGAFTCPLPFEPPSFTVCCGELYAEFCCLPEQFISRVSRWQTVGTLAFFAGMCCVGLLGLCLYVYSVGCRKFCRLDETKDHTENP